MACEMVVVCHIFSIYLLYKKADYDGSLMWAVPGFLGFMGVTLFFFMSGIVISNSLFKKARAGGYGFGSYFIDRFSRIYSGLVPCLLIIFALGVLIRAAAGPYYFRNAFPLAILLAAVRAAIDPYIGVTCFYDPVLEFLVGCAILLAVVGLNGGMRFAGGRLRGIARAMAGYSFTLYLLNMAVIAAILALDDLCGIHSPFPVVFAVSLASANLVACLVAYFTETRYKAVAGRIKKWAEAARLRFLTRTPT